MILVSIKVTIQKNLETYFMILVSISDQTKKSGNLFNDRINEPIRKKSGNLFNDRINEPIRIKSGNLFNKSRNLFNDQ